MAFISEIKYDGSGEGAHNEFVEITLSPLDDPADIILGLYEADGTLNTTASSFFPGVGEISMQDIIDLVGGTDNSLPSTVGGLDLEVRPHPDDPSWLIIVIPSAGNAGTGNPGYEALSLYDASTSTVLNAYDAGTNSNSVTFTEGLASGTTPVSTLNGENDANNNRSLSWTANGTQSRTTPNALASVLCIAEGAEIATPAGHRKVEMLAPGDLLLTADGSAHPLIAILKTDVSLQDSCGNAKLWPITISKDALGAGMPAKDLRVSRQHRMMLRSVVAERMFGSSEVLVPAIRLLGLPGISCQQPIKSFSYYHLLTDRHDVILANGAPTETLLSGEETVRTIDHATHIKSSAPLPVHMLRVSPTTPARPIAAGKKAASMLNRISKNGHQLVEPKSEKALALA